MRTEATVIKIEDDRTVVRLNRKSACDGCHKATDGKGCSVCSLLGADSSFTAIAENLIGAKVGDRVVVETATSRVLFYAALVFLLPVVLALLCWGTSTLFTDALLWQAIVALIGFVGCFIGIWIYSERLKKKKRDVVIVDVL